jgi:hypothetical protein
VVGTRELDDFLVVFGENVVGVIYGSGPAPTGLQGAYSDFATKAPEMGADWNSPKSILRAPEGVWFKSTFGIRLFSRQGEIQQQDTSGTDQTQTGSLVDGYVNGNVVAVTGQSKQQGRFYQTDGTVLIWDYQWTEWTRHTGMSSIDAVFADGRYYYLSNISTVPMLRYVDTAVFTDVDDTGTTGVAYTGVIETAWFSFAGLQGFQRVYRLMLLGKNLDNATTPQTIALSVYQNFDGSVTTDSATVSTTPQNLGLVQLQHHMLSQKCESMKLAVSFRPTNGDSGRFRLTDLSLQVGVKPGYYKLPSSQRF